MNSVVSKIIACIIFISASASFAAQNCSVAPFAAEVLEKQQTAWAAMISNSAKLSNFSVVRYSSGTTVLSESADQVVYDYSPNLVTPAGEQIDFVTRFHAVDGTSKQTAKRSFEITGKIVENDEGTFCQSELKHFEPELELKSVDYLLLKDEDKVAADVASKQNLSYFFCIQQGGSAAKCAHKSTQLPKGYKLQNLLQDVTATAYKIK